MGKFSSSKIQLPTPASLAPPRGSSETADAARRQRLAEKRRLGRRGTILASLNDDDSIVRRPEGTTAFAAKATKKKFG